MKKADNGKRKAEAGRLLVVIRDAIHDDLDDILACERESFDDPLKRGDFKRIARNPDRGVRVALRGGIVVGHLVFHVADRAVSIDSLAVADGVRRRGVGSQLVADIRCLAANANCRDLDCTVRETNLAGQLFFRANRFRACRIAKRPYRQVDEDGYVFRYDPHPDQPGQTTNRLAALGYDR